MAGVEKTPYSTIQRIPLILELLAKQPEGLSMTAIVDELGKPPKSSIFVILQQLVKNGYISFQEPEKKYKIGPSLIRLSSIIMNGHTIQKHVRYGLGKLSGLTGEDAYLGILNGDRLQYLDKVEGKESIRVNISIGFTRYLYANAIGKLLLANLDEEAQKRIIEGEKLHPITRNTITDIKKLYEEIGNIKKKGFAISQEEGMEGVYGFAAPIRNSRNEVIAGIAIAAPAMRAVPNKDRLIQLIMEVADEISKQLGAEEVLV